MDIGASTPQTSPVSNGTLNTVPIIGTQVLQIHDGSNINNFLMTTFTTPVGSLPSTAIVAGTWDMNLYALSSNAGITYHFSIYEVASNGTELIGTIATGTSLTGTPIGTQNIYVYSLYVNAYTLQSLNSRVQIKVFANFTSGTKTLTLEFRGNTMSHVHTTLIANSVGPSGATGPSGADSTVPGPTGPTGPFSQALANKILVSSVSGVTDIPLTWSTGSPASIYVPLLADSQITYTAPIKPTTGTGWRFYKTYTSINVALGGPTLTNGSTYTIVTIGTVNWVAIGASAATVNTQFTYNGVAITGTGGTVTTNQKISWFSLNALYGLALPQGASATPQTLVPDTAVTKANLKNVWFLVAFNADLALQGALAIQIETYAYQYAGNTTNSYTGRWAYSFPLQQGYGFSAQTTTNITSGAGVLFPRLRAGFTYLLYASDTTPSYLPGLIPSSTFYNGGAGLFSPSQVNTEHTLRDPYDLYPEYPHFAMSASSYTQTASGPTYSTTSGPYSDPGSVEVASIYLNTSSTAPYIGIGQTVTDFTVLAMGYNGVNTSNQLKNYALSWL